MKRGFYRALCLLLCVSLLLPLSGCGGVELYERLLIHGIGIDRDGDGVLVTVRSSTSESEELLLCRGETVLSALSSLSLATGRKPFYAHNYLVVFGMACAEAGLEKDLDFFVRYYSTRPAVQVYLAEGTAREVLSGGGEEHLLKMSELAQLSGSSRETGFSVEVELLDFMNAALSPGRDPVAPVLRAEGEGARVVASAFFRDYEFCGLLSPTDTRGLLAARDSLREGEAVVEGSFGRATLSLERTEGEIALGEDIGGLPAFEISLKAEADVSTVSQVGTSFGGEIYTEMENALTEELRREVQAAIRETAVAEGCDAFGFGNLLYRRAPERWRALAPHWREVLPRCTFSVKVSCEIHREEQESLGPLQG